MRLLAMLWGVLLMSVSVLADPISLLLVPDERFAPSAIMTDSKTTAVETAFDMEVDAATANIRDLSGWDSAELKASGHPTSSTSLTVDTAIAGIPGKTARYTYTTSSTTYGASEPFVLTGFETVAAVTSGNGYVNPRNTATPDGRVHEVYEDRTSGTGSIKYRYRVPSTEAQSSAVTVWTALQTLGSGGYSGDPEIWWVRSDTDSGYVLYVGAWYATASGTQVFRVSRSRDAGTTWSHTNSNLSLQYSALIVFEQTRVAYDPVGRQLTLIFIRETGGVKTSRLYVSNDRVGGEWTRISAGDVDNTETHDLKTPYPDCGTVVKAYTITGSNAIRVAQRDATTAGWVVLTSDTGATADVDYLALGANDSGWLYMFYRRSTDEEELMLQVSTDGGRTWGAPDGEYPYDDGGQTLVMDDDASAGTTTLVDGVKINGVAWVSETAYVIGTLVTSATTVDNSVVMLLFGGISNITLEEAGSGTDAPYYPSGLPATKSPSYTFTTGGATAEAIELDAGGRLVHALDNDNSTGYIQYDYIGNPSVAGFAWKIGPDTAGGQLGALYVGATLVCHNDADSNNYVIQIFIDDTSTPARIRAYDVGAAAYLGTAVEWDKTEDLSVLAALNGETGTLSYYIRQPGDKFWTTGLDGQALTATGTGAATTRVRWGKLTASTANVDTLMFVPFGSASTGFIADIADGIDTTDLVPIRATVIPQRTPHEINLFWRGVLQAGDQWTVSTISRDPLALTSPLASCPSPTRQHVGASGSAAATYRIGYDFGSGYESKLSPNLIWAGVFNAPQIATFRLQSWDGATFNTAIEGTTYWRPFGADGAVGFARASAATYAFTPNGTNGTPRAFRENEIAGWWCRISDGTDSIAGYIKRNSAGQFTTASTALRMTIELDPSTVVVEGGAAADLATTTTGNLVLVRPDAVAVGIQSADAVRYYALSYTLVPMATVPRIGLITAGSASILARTERDGASYRFMSPDEISRLPSVGLSQGRRVTRRTARAVELSYEQQLLQPGRLDAGTVWNTLSIQGTTQRATLDNNLDVIESAHRYAGQRMPVVLLHGASFGGTDPTSSAASFGGEQVLLGFMEAQVDRVAAQGLYHGLTSAHMQGGRLVIREEV